MWRFRISDAASQGSDREPAQANVQELPSDGNQELNIKSPDAFASELLNAFGCSEPEQDDQASNGSLKKDNTNVLFEDEGLDYNHAVTCSINDHPHMRLLCLHSLFV